MKQKIQGIIIGICMGTLLSSGVVFAKQIEETIKVTYSNIKIVVNGTECVPTDSNGNNVEPFIYNGTTYVPIRSVSQAFNKTVDWDSENNTVVISDKKSVETDKLPAIEVKGDYISPTNGVGIDKAKELIAKYLIEQGYKGDVKNNIVIKEITIQQAWAVNKMQIYSVTGYATGGVAAISDGKVDGVIHGMPTKTIYLADINNDKKYELCTNVYFGSGIVDLRIGVLDTYNLKQYELSKRMEYDLLLAVDEKSKDLIVYKVATYQVNTEEKVLLGKLWLDDNQLVIVDK